MMQCSVKYATFDTNTTENNVFVKHVAFKKHKEYMKMQTKHLMSRKRK